MARVYKIFKLRNTRQALLVGLVFFLSGLVSCSNKKDKELEIQWTNDRATGILIRKNSGTDAVSVKLSKGELAVLGNLEENGDKVLFRPLIPFTPGFTYEVFAGKRLLGSVAIPSSTGNAPSLLAIFPSEAVLPENLLKFYFKFSQPMRAGESRKHIHLLNSKKDTLDDVFLDLQPELWDTSGTVLTLWLDPGRIKRDLKPNLRLGSPLKSGETYTVVISAEWKDLKGMALSKVFSKQFTVGNRDNDSPDMHTWKLVIPGQADMDPIHIQFPEPLDHFLLGESFSIMGESGKPVRAKISIANNDREVLIYPSEPWKAGNYILKAESRLEDLAGNNLARPFERDLTKRYEKAVYNKLFTINNDK